MSALDHTMILVYAGKLVSLSPRNVGQLANSNYQPWVQFYELSLQYMAFFLV